MLSKNKQKYIRQFSLKKHRDGEMLFVAEGPKVVEELAAAFPCRLLCATAPFLASHDIAAQEVIEVNEQELTAASNLKTPQQVLAILEKPDAHAPTLLKTAAESAGSELVLALDGIQDPGNMGTILRLADWFGIRRVVCSPDTADAFSPKVVQATMGALARVSIAYTDLPSWLATLPKDCPVYGTHLDGSDIYAQALTPHGVIIMGNEGKGISAAVSERVTHRLRIPSFPPGEPTSESLNVATATAIVCAEFRRRMQQ